MTYQALHRYPFFRLLLPLIAGIVCDEEFAFFRSLPLSSSLLLFGMGLFVLFACQWLARFYKPATWIYGIDLSFLLFLVGGVSFQLSTTPAIGVPFPNKEMVYHVLIKDKPVQKERSVSCKVTITDCQAYPARKQSIVALLYLFQDSSSARLISGDELLVSTRFAPPANQGNPDEFDYVRFLARSGIQLTGYAYKGKWTKIGHVDDHSLQALASNLRDKLLAHYQKLGFSGDNLAVLSALTVGYKADLSNVLRDSYSVAGVSHVLALSGLHIGFLYVLLLFCFRPLSGTGNTGRIVSIFLILLTLWLFAFFTGFSASVVRSVVMCSLFGLSQIIRRNNFSLNTLWVAAFFMLLVHPSWLYDVGFQLSFSAVAAILILHPFVYRLFRPRTKVLSYVWGIISLSLVAQIGTAPLVAFYFYRFSTHFLLTNLLVIPLVTMILYGAVAMLILSPFAMLQTLLAVVVRYMIQFLNMLVRQIEHLPFASIDGIYLTLLEVVGCYFLFGLYYLYFRRRSARNLLLSLSCTFLFLIGHFALYINNEPSASLCFYNVRHCPAIHCIVPGGQSYLVSATGQIDTLRIQRSLAKHWNRLHLSTPQTVTSDYSDRHITYHNSVLSFRGRTICFVCDDRWRDKAAVRPLPVDFLYICKGYKGRIGSLSNLFLPRQVILDSSLSDYYKSSYEQECLRLGINFFSLSKQGSATFLLDV